MQRFRQPLVPFAWKEAGSVPGEGACDCSGYACPWCPAGDSEWRSSKMRPTRTPHPPPLKLGPGSMPCSTLTRLFPFLQFLPSLDHHAHISQAAKFDPSSKIYEVSGFVTLSKSGFLKNGGLNYYLNQVSNLNKPVCEPSENECKNRFMYKHCF